MKNTPIIKTLRPLKRLAMSLLGRDYFFKTDVILKTIRLGSEHGGWQIPVNTVTEKSVVYSGGIGTDISFDLALISEFKTTIHAFDPTPRTKEWLKTQSIPKQFNYYEWGLADYDGEAEFHVPKNPDHISHSMVESQVTQTSSVKVDVRRISTISQTLGHEHIDLLKIDIEGAEYPFIYDMLQHDILPTLLLVEFHHRFKSIGAKKTKEAVRALRAAGYQLFSVSPIGEEFCFILKGQQHSPIDGT